VIGVGTDNRAGDCLQELMLANASVDAAVLASVDGFCLASVGLADGTESAAAAMAAAALALGQQILLTRAESGTSPIREFVLRSADQDVALYRVSHHAALAVFAQGGSNIAMLHLHVRRILPSLMSMPVTRITAS